MFSLIFKRTATLIHEERRYQKTEREVTRRGKQQRRKTAHAASAREVEVMNLSRCGAQGGWLRWNCWLLSPRGPPWGHLDSTASRSRVRIELLCGWMDTDLNQGFLQLTNGLLQAVQPPVSDASNGCTCFSLLLNGDTVISQGRNWSLQ